MTVNVATGPGGWGFREQFVAGTSLGDYTLLEELGAGGMGVAYKAFDAKLKRTVALKMLRLPLGDSSSVARRLLREARAAAALVHPNICTIHTVAEADGVPFIVMEYVKGRTLASLVKAGPMDAMRVTTLALQVVDALAAAHARGIIHRDIKPANIVLTDEGQVKLLDFGLAGPLLAESAIAESALPDAPSTATIDRSYAAVGTLGYMSPEQIEGHSLDGRTDLFSLGVVLYELSTGRNPFIAPTGLATVGRVLTASPTPIGELVSGFPSRLDQIIQRCLAKRRDDRYASAAELWAELAQGASRPLWRRRDVQAMPSVAVLPFAGLANLPTYEYLADGITVELTSKLAQAGNLLVISRTSSMRFKGVQRDVREIGRELGVRSLVEGVVRLHDQRCVLTVNLIDVGTGFHTWTGAFETTAAGVFDVISEIVRQIVAALRVPARGSGRPLSTPPPERGASREVLEWYLRAVHAYHKFSSADNLVAIELLQRAITRDPGYARAHALLANAYLARVERGWQADEPRWLGLALEESAEALRLDPRISEAYSARGLIAFFGKRCEDAEADAHEALRADRNNDIAHDLLGRVRFARGEFLGAISAYSDALVINPYYIWCLNDLAWAQWLTGRDADAERTIDRVLSLSPEDEGGHSGRAGLLLLRGAVSEALAEIEHACASNPQYPFVLILMPAILPLEGRHDEAMALCEALAARPESAFFGHAGLGLVCARTGDRARLMQSVGRALAIEPFYAAMSLTYARLYDAAGETAIAEDWMRKAVRDGIRLVEVNDWHPRLQRLAVSAGLIPTRSDDDA